MPRPRKCRKVCELPETDRFGPMGGRSEDVESVCMTVEEYETIRLIDLENFTQQECSEQMHVARSTVQAIYNEARKKLANALVNGKLLRIEGGDYKLCSGHSGNGCGRKKGCRRWQDRPHGEEKENEISNTSE